MKKTYISPKAREIIARELAYEARISTGLEKYKKKLAKEGYKWDGIYGKIVKEARLARAPNFWNLPFWLKQADYLIKKIKQV